MPVHAVALEKGFLIPVQPQPTQGSQDGFGMLGLGSVAVGILDAEDELTSVVPCEQPIEESSAGAADV